MDIKFSVIELRVCPFGRILLFFHQASTPFASVLIYPICLVYSWISSQSEELDGATNLHPRP